MRRSIEELRTFYGEPAGALARRLLARRLEDAWGEAASCDVLGVGYATPWLDAFVGARRVVAAMPGGQGVELWPPAGRNRTVLVDDRRLPFAAGSFDRILLVHALEEAEDAAGLLTEAVRALAPAGRIILIAAARGGLWSRVEATPFGHGRPFTRRQLEQLVRAAGLDVRQILTCSELVSSNEVFFAATGITDGSLLSGVRYHRDEAETESLVLRGETGTRRFIRAEHRLRW